MLFGFYVENSEASDYVMVSAPDAAEAERILREELEYKVVELYEPEDLVVTQYEGVAFLSTCGSDG